MKKVFDEIDRLNGEYIKFLEEVCTIESPTDYKEGVDRVGKYFSDKAAEKGWLVEKQHQEISGDVVCITMNPESENPPVCFSGHMDTVHPVGSFGEKVVSFDEKKIYGPGVIDCKGGIVASFMAMDALQRCGFKGRPIKLILQSDEENGSRNSRKTTVKYMHEKAKGCVAFLNTEPGDKKGHIIVMKGICKFRFEITGSAAHSSVCDSGASAICEAAQKIIRLEQYKDRNAITCNCGLIDGGSAENTVPERCTFTADFRFFTEEQRKEIMNIAKEISETSFVEGTKCTLILSSSRCAMERTKANTELFEKVRDIFAQNNLGDIEMLTGLGGADSSDMTQMGIPCLESFGLIGGGIHKETEFAYLESLPLAAKKLAAVAYCI